MEFDINKLMDGIAVSSRVRLARNLSGLVFPTVFGEKQKEIAGRVEAVLKSVGEFRRLDVKNLSGTELLAMKERYLISADLIENRETGSVILSDDETVSIMINEEDHVREQCFLRGLNLRDAYAVLDRIDDVLSGEIEFAFDPKRGYLTSCPTNLGTGMRASVMLFLPALTLSRSIASIMTAVSKERIEVRGVYGEGSDTEGCLYQVSNQVSLGLSESEILRQVENVVLRIAEAEKAGRASLFEQAPLELRDRVMRAYGTLLYAVKIDSAEFMKLFSDVKLGAALGILPLSNPGALDEIAVKVRPANLILQAGKELSAEERDVARADTVRKTLQTLAGTGNEETKGR